MLPLRTYPLRLRLRLLALALPASMILAAACFNADVPEEIHAVYSCEGDEDCLTAGFRCIESLCHDDRGPQLSVLGPEPLQVFAADQQSDSLTITLRHNQLQLTQPGTAHREGFGHIEIWLDETLLTTVTAGQGSDTIALATPNWPSVAGLHRIVAIAKRNDGLEYINESARAQSAFWIDDGKARVGIIRPNPYEEIAVDAPVEVEIHTINYALTNPNTADLTDNSGTSGHMHLFFGQNIPACLSEVVDCNGSYVSSVFPSEGVVNQIVWEGKLTAAAAAGLHNLSVVLQTHQHQPFPSPDANEVAYDSIAVEVPGHE